MKQFKMKLNNKRKDFLVMLLGSLGSCLLGNILAGKGINRAGEEVIRAGYGNKRQHYKNKMDF